MANFYRGNQNGQIALIDPAASTLINEFIPNNDVQLTALAYDPTTNTWFGVTRNFSPLWPKALVSIDLQHGTFAHRGDLSLPGGASLSDISINASGQIYAVLAGSGSQLCSIDKLTGVATPIGSATSYLGGGCSFISGTFYWLPQDGVLLTVDLSTGVTTIIASVTGVHSGRAGAMDYDIAAGKLIYSRASDTRYYHIDPVTAVTTFIHTDTTTDSFIDAIAYGPLVPYLRPFLPAPSIATDDGWFVDFIDHDDTILQTVRPENLHFVRRISAVEDADWTLSRSAKNTDGGPAVYRVVATNEDMVKPYANGFKIRRMVEGVEFKIMAGLITNTNMALGRDNVRISGKDWMHYLDRRQIPFTSSDPLAYRFGTTVDDTDPPVGFTYQEISRDVALIVKDILAVVLTRTNSLPIDYSGLAAIGHAINFSIGLGDTSTILSLIDGISQYWPGFDYRVSYDRVFQLWAPTRFGNPDSTASDGSSGPNITLLIGDVFDAHPVSLEFTNGGILASHLKGEGAGTQKQTQLSKSLGASDIQAAFWRLDGAESFGDQAKTQDIVDKRTRQQFIFGAQEIHDIQCEIDPLLYAPDIFWDQVHPGLACWIKQDLHMHEIDSAQRIMEMDCTINNQGDERVKLGLNQIYNTSTHYGVDQG